jgi:hypothetical protein
LADKEVMPGIQALLFLMLMLAPFASAQFPLSVGVKGGVPLTNPLGTAQGAFSFGPGAPTETLMPETSKTYLVGPMVEFRLPLRFSVEADGLFHPIAIPFVEQTSFSLVLLFVLSMLPPGSFRLLRNIIFLFRS